MLILGIVTAAPASAAASMQLVALDEQIPAGGTAHVLHGLNGSPEVDSVTIAQSGTEFTIRDQVGISSFPADCHRLAADSAACPIADYVDLAVFTGPADDRVVSMSSFQNLTLKQIQGPNIAVYVNANLGPGNDVFRGGPGTEAVAGSRGRDRMVGNGGNDLLEGGAGNDLLAGGDGADIFLAGKGRDTCVVHGRRDLIADCEHVRL
jgi:Ca2+-binding RTX toxin-like protein